ncbi:ricin-type beta-trefoil lectin domain protein [Streptomyces sp. NPDC005077]|uniref:ricin-type beta-trefoil lectin domain protein n=1 Tax=Streptomyces sp. NPDC005077 TaxID=3154292 RepID=UPI0033A48B17
MTENPASVPSSSQKAPAPAPSRTGPDQAAKKSPSAGDSRDPATLDIRTALCPAEIGSAAHGVCVKALQMLLTVHGLRVTIDRRFGEATLAAVRAFQTEGSTVDGKVGEGTKKLLYGKPPRPVRAGSVTVTQSVNGASVARCLDTRCQNVQVWRCKSGATQKWAVPGVRSELPVPRQSGQPLLSGGRCRNGQKIRARSCDGQRAQRWRLGSGGTLVSVPDGFCLDVLAATSGHDGQRVQGWGCAGSINPVWTWS